MEKTREEIKRVFESKSLFRILFVLGISILVMFIFSLGTMVGFHRATFGRAWEENYIENFGMGRRNLRAVSIGNVRMTDNFPNAHGATGKIIKIELPNVFVQDKNSAEKIVSIRDDTNMQKGRINIQTNDLLVDDYVVAVGSPNDKGVIEAKLLRVIPRPEFLNQ